MCLTLTMKPQPLRNSHTSCDCYENHNVTCIDLSTQLADDTTVFLKRSEQIPLVINKIHIFSEVSGLHLNPKKSVNYSIQNCHVVYLYGIPVLK